LKEVPVIRVKVSEREMKTLNLALNRISGEWDEAKLAPILNEIRDLPELDLTGFKIPEVSEILAEYAPVITFDEAPKSVQRNIEEMRKFKEMRKEGNRKVQEKTDTECYLVIVFASREARETLLAELGLPKDERYLAADSLTIKRAHRLIPLAEKAAVQDKAGATG
jgi:hypothetical protein